MPDDDLAERLLAHGSGDIDQIDADDLIFYLEYLDGHQKQWKREVLLRLALHFTPRQAIADTRDEEHDFTDFDSEKEPYQMITDHLKENHSFTDDQSEEIGKLLGKLWYEWVEERDSLRQSKRDALKSKLKREQNNRCKNCGVILGEQSNSIAYSGDDYFKPIHEFSDPQMDGELDHIEPVSQFGHDKVDNFQLLCRFCNQGKEDDITISLADRLRIASIEPKNISKGLRRSLFHEVSSKYDKCSKCGEKVTDVEITIRKRIKQCSLTASNLEAVCAECVK